MSPIWSAAADEDAVEATDAAPGARIRRTRTPLRTLVVRTLSRYTRPFPFVRLEPTRTRR